MFLAPLLLSALIPPQELKILPSTLKRVTVYNEQALAERVFHVPSADAGPVSFEIGPLPMVADSSSVQIRLESGNAVMQGLEVRTRSGSKIEGTQRDALRTRMTRLLSERREYAAKKKGIEAGFGYVDYILQSVSQGTDLGSVWNEGVFQSVQEKSASLDEEMARWEVRDQEMADAIDDLTKQLGRLGQETRSYKMVMATVHFETPGEATFRLSYLVSNAWWQPTYDVRVSPDLTGVSVGLVAQVSQRTDEDWEDVELHLSTSMPTIGLNPPALPSRVMELPKPPSSMPSARMELGYLEGTAVGSRDNDVGLGGGAGGKYGGRKGSGARSPAPTVSVQDFGLSAQFVLPVPKTVRSGGEIARLPLRKMPLAVEPERYVVPSVSELAFLRADVVLTGDAPFLAGPAKIYLGPDYLGEAAFPAMRPGDSTSLDLGIDPNLSVTYVAIKDLREDPGFLSSTSSLTRTFRTTLKLSSSASGPVQILVEDVLPLSQDDRIDMAPYELNPAPLQDEDSLKLQEERGVYRWRIKLSPGATSLIHWGYEASFDSDLNPVLVESF